MGKISCRKRRDTWAYRFTVPAPGGKTKEITKSGFRTKKEAYDAGAKALDEYNNIGRVVKVSDMLYSDLLDEWMYAMKLELKETSWKNYEKNIRLHIKPALGNLKLATIDTRTLQDFMNTLFIKQYSHNRLMVIKGNITSSFRYAKKMDYIRSNPALELELPGRTENARSNVESRQKVRNVVTPTQWEQIMKRFPEGHSCHLPMVLAYKCGLRLGEAFGLTWDNVDFGNGTIYINHQIQYSDQYKCWRFTGPKYGSARTIEVDKNTLDLLRRTRIEQIKDAGYYAEYYVHHTVDANGCLDLDKNGTPVALVNIRSNGEYIQPRNMQHTSRIIHGLEKEPAISENFDFHSLRHTHTTILLEAGLDIKYVSERLGHKNIQTTLDIYAHLTDKIRETNKEKLENIFTS